MGFNLVYFKTSIYDGWIQSSGTHSLHVLKKKKKPSFAVVSVGINA